jgi:gamma-glutamylcyclotransferase (GGCT)/AIG2-like uncharacterized protein YtfP
MPKYKPFNLFVYGTLMNPSVFRAVLGRRLVTVPSDADGRDALFACDAVLNNYKKISPDSTYMYAVPDPQGCIRGYLVGPLPGECMAALRSYEGRNYSRRTLQVQTAKGPQRAVVFVGNLKQLKHAFGYPFRDPFKQEVLLRAKIDSALLEAEKEQLHTTEGDLATECGLGTSTIARRAVGQLHGSTIRDLVRQHFEAGGISDYAIRHSLRNEPLRDFARIVADSQAQTVAPNYLALVIRQAMFNEIEDRIYQDFRYELDHMSSGEDFYERTASCLAALRLLNAGSSFVDNLVSQRLASLPFGSKRGLQAAMHCGLETSHLVDYVRSAIVAADAIYSASAGREQVQFIRNHMGGGHVPFGAEMEFSNIGHGVIRDPQARVLRDPQYDGFLYFTDFALDVLTWKLGGHIDDHHEKFSPLPRRGFFELALGSLSIEADLSKPVTDDPWVLNQLIQECMRFYRIAPHSVHISLQIRSRRPSTDRILPIGILKCLFAIAGDPVGGEDGKVRINRLVSDEIIRNDPSPSMLFSEVSLRRSHDAGDSPPLASAATAGRYVQQFKFMRLSPRLNYEPIVMALKGIQLALSPGTFMTAAQFEQHRKHRKTFEELISWGADPQPIPLEQIEEFLGAVHQGLSTEHRARSAHSGAYVAWSLSQLRDMLRSFNAMLRAAPVRHAPAAGP